MVSRTHKGTCASRPLASKSQANRSELRAKTKRRQSYYPDLHVLIHLPCGASLARIQARGAGQGAGHQDEELLFLNRVFLPCRLPRLTIPQPARARYLIWGWVKGGACCVGRHATCITPQKSSQKWMVKRLKIPHITSIKHNNMAWLIVSLDGVISCSHIYFGFIGFCKISENAPAYLLLPPLTPPPFSRKK